MEGNFNILNTSSNQAETTVFNVSQPLENLMRFSGTFWCLYYDRGAAALLLMSELTYTKVMPRLMEICWSFQFIGYT